MNAMFDQTAERLYLELQSCQKVAKRLNVGPSTVHRALTRRGVKLPPRGDPEMNLRKCRFAGEEAARVVEMYISGAPMRRIKQEFKCEQAAIYSAIKRAGVARRPRGQQPTQLTPGQVAEIVKLRAESNLSQTVIAARIGCSQAKVSAELKRAGLISRPHSVGHGSWKGGRVNLGGYVGVLAPADWPYPSMINSSGYVLEHRMVIAKRLGRAIGSDESIHHIDGNKENNAPDNLQLRQGKHGKGIRMICRDCGSHNLIAEEL